MPPSISVIIPTYNRLPFLLEAIESVRQQTSSVQEILIIDDGSTDDTKRIVSTLPLPIRYIWQSNMGPAAARNRGILEANGDWIAFLDSDDLWTQEKIEEQISFIEANPLLEFVFGNMCNFDSQSTASAPEILDQTVYEYCRAHASNLVNFFECLLRTNPVPTPSVLFRRSAVAKIGLLRQDLFCCEDFEWWTRWALKARCGFLDKVSVKRRLHSSNIISDRLSILVSVASILNDLAMENPELSPVRKFRLLKAIHQHRYRLGSEYYFRHEFGHSTQVLSSVYPWFLMPGDSIKCATKLLFGSIQRGSCRPPLAS